MKSGSGTARTWLVATIASGGAIALLVTLFRIPKLPPAEAAKTDEKPKVAAVRLAVGSAAGDPLLNEEAMLRDPAPLFLPTGWNAAENALPATARREPVGAFDGYPAYFRFDQARLDLAMAAPVVVPERPADAFASDKPARPFLGFGQTDVDVAALPSRTAYVEVLSAGEGKVMLAQPLRDVRPPGEAVWQPLEFLIAVDPAGLVRPPVLTESSTVTAVDEFFQDYLATGLHLGELLGPGFYRVSIGP